MKDNNNDMIMRIPIRGQCFCGHVQFEIRREALSACHCHCESCQRASGAPFVTWATFRVDDFELTKGTLTERLSSPGVTRGHCSECGTTMTYTSDRKPDEIDVTVTCMDQPAIFKPSAHIWIEDKQPWLDIGDELPQFERWSTPD